MNNLPNHVLIFRLNEIDGYQEEFGILSARYGLEEMEQELESRYPLSDYYYFGDCAGKPVFVPIADEQDECVGYDDNGEPILYTS